MMHMQERILLRRSLAITAEIENILKRDYDVEFFKPSVEDQIRLLRIGQWRERHSVSLQWILKQLIPFWRSRHARYNKRAVLGTKIPTFIGRVSETYLLEQIAAQFPNGENHAHWRVREQDRQFHKIWDGPTRENWNDPEAMVIMYAKRMAVERGERHEFQEKMQKRPHRNNPWME